MINIDTMYVLTCFLKDLIVIFLRGYYFYKNNDSLSPEQIMVSYPECSFSLQLHKSSIEVLNSERMLERSIKNRRVCGGPLLVTI